MTHIPERSCIGCRRKGPKDSFLRIVRSGKTTSAKEAERGEDFVIDRTGKEKGRGAYLCNSAECLTLAAKHHALERAFRCKAASDVYEALSEALTAS